jgi:hypothetical protein
MPQGRATAVPETDRRGDGVLIAGRLLPFDDLLTQALDNPDFVAAQRARYHEAKPFPHLVIGGLFDDRLLDLVVEEFGRRAMRPVQGAHESTLRPVAATDLGPAAQTYINLVHSHRFMRFVSAVTGIDHLLVDHGLLGGGLHETRRGGRFGIHRDFNLHRGTLLANRMVLITYLNRDWPDEYGGALELWDARARRCVTSVPPLFGTTVLMGHSEASFHGHPEPLACPEDRTRKSIAVYYYENELAKYKRASFRSSLFLADLRHSALPAAGKADPVRSLSARRKAKSLLRDMVPPIIWFGARRFRRYRAGRKGKT